MVDSCYFVYMLECVDGTYYTGFTIDLEKRVKAHNNLKTGAKYTKSRRPVILVYFETYASKSVALKREFVLKQLTREEKRALIQTHVVK